MGILFVTRHPGAREWARQEGLTVDRVCDHLDLDALQAGDVVIGTLPIHLAAQVCERGGHYLHLSLEVPPDRRGTEFSTAEMRTFGARLEEYVIHRVKPDRTAG